MNPSYDPDKLNVSKPEIMDYLHAYYIRLKNNPRVPRMVRGRFWADMKLIETFETEDQLKYHICLMLELIDGIRSIIERKDKPELGRLNGLHKEAVIRKLVIPPDVRSDFDAMKALAEAKAVMRMA